jgi:fatty-acid desaturase
MGRTAAVSDGLSWGMLLVIGLFHAGALAALFLFSWQRLLVMAVIYVLAINVGIGMCYHRLLTHRGYQVPRWLEYLMTFFATLSLEGGPIFWVSTHRVPTRRARVDGGRTPVGYSSVNRCTRRPRCSRATRLTSPATVSTSG